LAADFRAPALDFHPGERTRVPFFVRCALV
jgi:hypothetical protein